MSKDAKIIVSSCLAGFECRYDCQSKTNTDILQMVVDGIAIPVCPEQMGGLSTPREAAEIQGDKVITKSGNDVTEAYQKGVSEALKTVSLVGASEAILKSKSPMCGVEEVYDGSFSGKLTTGDGIFAQALKRLGVKVSKR